MRCLIWFFILTCAVWAQPIEIALFEGGEGLDYFQRCALEFSEARCQGDPRISEKLRIRLLEGKPPEVTNASLPFDQLIAKGKVLALDRWLEGPNWEGSGRWRDDFLPGSLERFRVGGHIYGIPLQYTVQACYYSRANFRAHGWVAPKTWEEWVQLCGRVETSGQAALAFQGRYTYYASPLIQHCYYYLAGPRAYADQFTLKAGSFDNAAMIDSLHRVQQLAREHFQPGALGMSHTEAQLEFLQGHAAMLVCGSWFKSEMRDKIPAGFELAEFALPPPAASRTPPAAQVGAGYFFVFSESAQPARGVDYLRLISSRARAAELVAAQDLPVAVRGANNQLSPDLDGLRDILAQSRASFGEGLSVTHPGMAQVWADVRFDLLQARATPAELAQRLETAAARLRDGEAAAAPLFPWRPWLLLAAVLGLVLLGKSSEPAQASHLRRLPWADALWLAGPPLFLYALFFWLPGLSALLASGCEWDGLSAPHWVGGANFRQLLQSSPRFWQALGNNLFLMACIPTLITVWSLLFAVLLQPDRPGHRFLRALYFLPNLLGIGAILIWQQIYHPQGPLNRLLGWENFTWLSQDHLYPSMLPLALWSAGGFQLVLCSAALAQVPSDLVDAARLEGANRWQQFWAVSWPCLRPTVLAGYFLLLIGAVKSFETIWLFTNQEPTSQVHVLGTLLVQTAFAELKLGEATALAVILLVLVLALQRALHRLEAE
ncbi:MAG: extracellular solute-binding protein [Candidatus Eremiobacteraeota bacterium]|nr:extracellular solute-binding protein [Candidatus Eremiobacteraeota bacterium]MCW5868677.1 extracellular solute-binding protein [Candidatus Eremiobacteraeota bacterium]